MSTREQRKAWLRRHPELWLKPTTVDAIVKAMKAANLLARSTYWKDCGSTKAMVLELRQEKKSVQPIPGPHVPV